MSGTLTDDEIKALLAGCEGVTPGPWKTHLVNSTQICTASGASVAITCEAGRDDYVARMDYDAAHIARCDPKTISKLCDEVLTLRESAKKLRMWLAEEEQTNAD